MPKRAQTIVASLGGVIPQCHPRRKLKGRTAKSTIFRWLACGRAGDPRFTTLLEIVAQQRKPFDWITLFGGDVPQKIGER
jgi:hypothetical protein